MVQKSRKKYSKKTKSNVLSKFPTISKIIIALCFVIGLAASFFALKFVCKNDCFELNGKKSITLVVGEDYLDNGATVIGFGKDLSNKLQVTVYKNGEKVAGLNSINTEEESTYQIVFTVSSFRFKNVQLIRTLVVVPVEDTPFEE